MYLIVCGWLTLFTSTSRSYQYASGLGRSGKQDVSASWSIAFYDTSSFTVACEITVTESMCVCVSLAVVVDCTLLVYWSIRVVHEGQARYWTKQYIYTKPS